jgi:Flp pilus assembly CpaE family ATPase
MNVANMLSNNMFDKNILYIDLSTTKAVSNLFLEQNPVPEKTIIDLINSGEYDVAKNLENGLVEVRENFYAVTGIQKQIDKELLEKDTFIGKLLDYIKHMSDHFNYILIDIGTADASHLKTTIYDLVNEIWLVTEMTLPHISKLKTFYNLLKRAGLKEKTSFLINRYDSECAISIDDILSILNMEEDDKFFFDFKIKNDYKTLGRAWNYCELASDVAPDSVFVKSLEHILTTKQFYTKEDEQVAPPSKGLFSFLGKGDK